MSLLKVGAGPRPAGFFAGWRSGESHPLATSALASIRTRATLMSMGKHKLRTAVTSLAFAAGPRPCSIGRVSSGTMADAKHYVIRGGTEGRERLRVLGRVMHASSMALVDRLGPRDGAACLDVGCGGGDVTLALARRVAPHGQAVGVDIDETKLELARHEAHQQGVANAVFQLSDIREMSGQPEFDIAYSRFVLTHLPDPAGVVRALYARLRPGGMIGVEDIDFSGYFTHPKSQAFERYHELYCATVSRRGGDPNIGPRLPLLLKECGFEGVGVCVVQPIATEGEAKLVSPMTMENIAGAVLEDGLATREEIDEVVRELYAFAADPNTVAGVPRVVQSWGRRPLA